MGPLIPAGNLEKFVEFFPIYHVTKPIADKTKTPKDIDEGSARKPTKTLKEKTFEETSLVSKTEGEVF